MNQNRMESSDLVDIRTVTVDKSLPKEERNAGFVGQRSNPYRFGCGEFVESAFFAGVIQCTWKMTKFRPSQKSLFLSAFPERKGVTFHGKVQSNCLYPSVLYR